jgi:hypothetical protein
MKKISVPILVFIAFIPAVLADFISPPWYHYSSLLFGLLLMAVNYIINFIIILIQSKIWLDIRYKLIAIGLLIITPVMFVVEYLLTSLVFDSYGWQVGLLSFPVIFLSYFLISEYLWKLENKRSLLTALIMSIVTNPGIFIFISYQIF